MRIPSDMELMAMWEKASGEQPVDRALTLLAACSDKSPAELARLSIGSRDARLLELYEILFGRAIDAFAHCPACAEPLEYSMSAHDLAAPAPRNEAPQLSLELGPASVRLRLPDSTDLRAISKCADPTVAGRLLLERCVLEARVDEQPVLPEQLPDRIVDAIASTLAEADPQAEMLIDLNCLACSHQWQVTLDIERFLWSKICAAARRLLREVHALASAYGWCEREILALSPRRRQLYLEMAWPTS